MDERDFDKNLADKLKNIDDFEYDESNWNALNSRLDVTNRYRFSALYTAAAILFLALLGINGWMGYQWYTTQHKLQEVNNILDALHKREETASTDLYVTDTIYKKTIIYQYDTIYHTVVYQHDAKTKLNTSDDQEISYHDKNTEAILKNEDTDSFQPENSQRQQNPSNPPAANGDNNHENNIHQPTSAADSLKENFPDLLTINESETDKPDDTVSPKQEREKPLQSHLLYLGISAQIPFISHPATYNSGGLGGGLRGMFSLHKQVNIILQANYLNVRYSVNDIDESLGIIDVNSGSPYQNDELVSVDNKQQFLQGSLGLSYFIGNDQKLRPFLSFSYMAETSLSRHLIYQYRDVNTDKIYLREADDNSGSTSWHILDAALGIEYKLPYRSLLHLEGYFNKKTGQETQVRPDQFGVRAAFYYHLK